MPEKSVKPRYFRSGDDADTYLEKKVRDAEQGYIPRVYMLVTPEDGEGDLYTFVDGIMNPGGYPTPYAFEEHNFKMNGRWRNHTTCIEGLPHPETGIPMACPICRSKVIQENQRKPYTAHAYTVINHIPYTLKDGTVKNENGDELTLLIAKTQLATVIKRKRRREQPNGGVRGWQGRFFRTDKKQANTGNEIQWEGKIEIPDDVLPFDYSVILAPKTPEQIMRALVQGGLADPVNYSGPVNSSIGQGDEEIPF